jgi:uncharacterized repeat protein (TIGR01451 family)
MNASRRVSLLFSAILVVLFAAQRIEAQCVSLTTLAAPSTQPFTALANAGTNVAWTDNSTIAGWYSTRTTYNAGTGSSNTGALYSFGVAGTNPVTDRSLGGVGSGGTGTFYWAACFTNNTGSALTSVDIAYMGEQWRDGGAAVPVAQTMNVEYQVAAPGTITDADTPTTGWTTEAALNFTSPTFTNTGAGVLLDGNAAANRTARAATITVGVPVGNQFWIRWRDLNDAGNDHGLAVDDFSITPQAVAGNAAIVPTCASPVTTTAGTATTQGVSATDSDGTVISATITGIAPSDPGTITLTGFTPAGGVGGTANATLNVSAATPANTYSVTIQWANNDGTPQTANCVVSVVVNAPPTVVFIHDVQGNGAATPIPGATVTIEGVVTGDFQPIPNDNRLSGFFVQEEDADVDADPSTSEGIFVFCSACPTNVAEGQRVQVTGTVSEFFNNTQITASTAGSVVITNAGNNLAQVTPATIDLPVVTPSIDTYYEPRENMLVNYVDTLTVSEYFEQARYGRIELYEGGRPYGFTEDNAPSVAGYAAHLDNLSRRRVYIDDDDNVENSVLNLPNGQQFVFVPQANGGLSNRAIDTQGPDFFRGGDLVNGLTGILHYSFSGGTSPDEWRIRPTAATPATFTVANPRPATPPTVGGAIRAASVNVLNYFTTLNQRGADSAAELNRQRERTSIVLCDLDADVTALMEIENHATNATIIDLLAAVNARCGGTQPYTFVNTGGALGTDEIRVLLIYRTGVLSPVGPALVDSDPIHNRPPTAQTFDVVDALNPAFGQRFTALANHSKSKGSCPGAGVDTDQGDGQGCWAPTRVSQHTRILTWVNGTVIPAAGDPDVLLLGDFNSNGAETPTTTLTSGGYTDLEVAFDSGTYSYVFDGQIGHLDYAFSSASLTPQVTGAAPWHINADENPLFDYNDEIDDGAAEQAFEEKPDGSALALPRVLFQPASPYRASDHDPVLVGLFAISDLVITKTDSPDPVNAGNNLTYTITVTNNGPDAAANASWTDTITGTTFVSLSSVAGWSCTTPAVGAAGAINCTNPSFGVGSAVFTLIVAVDPSTAAGTVLSNTASVTSASAEGNPGDESDMETTTVATSADLSVTKSDSPDPVTAGNDITYTITVNNAGPSFASTVELTDVIPTGTTFVSLANPGGWSCTTPAVGGTGTVSCTIASLGVGNAVFTLVVNVPASTAAGASILNAATVTSTTSDPNAGNETGNSETTVAASADLSVTKSDSPDPVDAGANLTYTITVNNAGPSNASTVTLTDVLPAEVTFFSLAAPAGWSCTDPGIFNSGTVSCSAATVGVGSHVFTLVVHVATATASGTVINNSATVATNVTPDPNSGNETGSSATTVTTSANISLTKTDSPDPVNAGGNITYTIGLANAGPSNAFSLNMSDTLPAGTTFVSLASPGSFTCTTPAVGATGTVSCTHVSSMVPGSSVTFTLVVQVDPSTAAGTVISNTAAATTTTPDPNTANNTATATTTVATSADLSVTKSDSPDPVNAGANLTYTITVNNAGPSNASTVTLTDVLPAEVTFFSLAAPAGWSCTDPGIFNSGTVSCSAAMVGVGSHVFTLVVHVATATASGTVINNSATVATNVTPDPNSGNETGSAATTVTTSASISLTKTDSPEPVTAGANITYTIGLANAGPSNAFALNMSDTLPAGTTFVSLASPGSFTCTAPAVGATGTVSCTHVSSMVPGASVTFTLVVQVAPSTAAGTVISNTAAATTTTPDPNTANNTATATTTVATSADLSVTKVDTPDPVTAGTNLTYTITVNNAGPSSASTVTLNDTVPANTTFVSFAGPAGWSCTTPAVGGTGNISCSTATLAPGNAVFTMVVAVGAGVADGTVITNTATAASPTDSNAANDSATATTTVGTGAVDLSIVKTDSPDPVTPGSNLTYQITITNNGPSNATSASFSDPLPAGTTFVSLSTTGPWTCTTPAVGANGTVSCSNPSFGVTVDFFTLVVNVGPSVAPATVLTNTATISSATTESNPGDESSTTTTTVGAGSADLSIVKTDSPDPVTPGSNIAYQITMTNSGPSNAASATFSDPLPAGTTFVSLSTTGPWTCTTPAVGANGTISCSNPSYGGVDFFNLVVNVDPTVAAGTILTNTATLASATADPNGANNSSTATTTVGAASADLSIVKTDSPDPVTPGSNIAYQITMTNSGPSNAASATFSDPLPAGTTFVSLSTTGPWTCTTPAVGANGTISCSNPSYGGVDFFNLVVNVDPSVAAGTILTNTATLASATADPNGVNNSSTATTTVGAASADLLISKTDSPDPVTAGTNLTYLITLTNNGPSNAASAVFNDPLPAGTTFVSLSTSGPWTCTTPAVGATGTVNCTNPSFGVTADFFTLVVNVDQFAAAGTILTNTATLNSAVADPNSANNSSTTTTTVGSASADLSVTKTDSPDPVTPGENVTYTITVTNGGPDTALGVSLTDTVPGGSTLVSFTSPAGWTCTVPAVGTNGTIVCSMGTMTVGSAVFTLVVQVNPILGAGVLTNTATVASSTTDPNPANNSGTATTTTLAGSADLLVSKSDSPDPVAPGANLTYQMNVTNNGPSTGANATFSDTLPAGTTFVSLSTTGPWTCTTPAVGATGTVTCTNPSFAETVEFFTLVVAVDASVPAGTILTNTATVGSTTADPNSANNSSTATTTVGGGTADLTLTKTDSPDPVSPGTNITYTITLNNAGPANAATAVLSDTTPVGTTFVSIAAPAGWNCTNPAVGGTGAISCSNASMAIGSAVFTLVVNVNPAATDGTIITNTATATSTTTDPAPGNESATATTTVSVTDADLSVTKVDGTDPVTAGANLTYTITANNAGPDAATNATLTDSLPVGTTFVSIAAPAGWTCTTPAVGANGDVTCSNASMTVGSAVFTLVVNVVPNTAAGTVLSNTATVVSTTFDPNSGNESDTETTNVISPANVTGTKTASGTFSPSSIVTYSIVLTNSGPAAQSDNPGNEFTDVLPAQLTLLSATATSGTALATVATNTVTWNGAIPNGGTVTITIQALIEADVPVGTTVSNQGTISYDADGNGTNEASNTTDDPQVGGGGNSTGFLVAAPTGIDDVPALDGIGLAALAALLAALGLVVMRRS